MPEKPTFDNRNSISSPEYHEMEHDYSQFSVAPALVQQNCSIINGSNLEQQPQQNYIQGVNNHNSTNNVNI